MVGGDRTNGGRICALEHGVGEERAASRGAVGSGRPCLNVGAHAVDRRRATRGSAAEACIRAGWLAACCRGGQPARRRAASSVAPAATSPPACSASFIYRESESLAPSVSLCPSTTYTRSTHHGPRFVQSGPSPPAGPLLCPAKASIGRAESSPPLSHPFQWLFSSRSRSTRLPCPASPPSGDPPCCSQDARPQPLPTALLHLAAQRQQPAPPPPRQPPRPCPRRLWPSARVRRGEPSPRPRRSRIRWASRSLGLA